jgi:hypothetical protein
MTKAIITMISFDHFSLICLTICHSKWSLELDILLFLKCFTIWRGETRNAKSFISSFLRKFNASMVAKHSISKKYPTGLFIALAFQSFNEKTKLFS